MIVTIPAEKMVGSICDVSKSRCNRRQSGGKCLQRPGVCSGSNSGPKICQVSIGMPSMLSTLLWSSASVRARNCLTSCGNFRENSAPRTHTRGEGSIVKGRNTGRDSWVWTGLMTLIIIAIASHISCRVIPGTVSQPHHSPAQV